MTTAGESRFRQRMTPGMNPKEMHVVSLLLLVLLLLLWWWWRNLEVLYVSFWLGERASNAELTSGWLLGLPAPVCSQGDAASAKLLYSSG